MGLIGKMPLKPFDFFHGYEDKRRVASFGWKFDFDTQRLFHADPIPDNLLPVRDVAARFADMQSDELQQVLVTEYAPGARSAGTGTRRLLAASSAGRCCPSAHSD